MFVAVRNGRAALKLTFSLPLQSYFLFPCFYFLNFFFLNNNILYFKCIKLFLCHLGYLLYLLMPFVIFLSILEVSHVPTQHFTSVFKALPHCDFLVGYFCYKLINCFFLVQNDTF